MIEGKHDVTEQTDKCGHPHCNCPAQMDTGYCCEYCEHADLDPEERCLCGHAECELRSSGPIP